MERREIVGRLMFSTMMLTSPSTPSRLIEIPLSVVFPQPISQPLPDFVTRNDDGVARQFTDVEFQNFTKTLDIDSGYANNSQIEGIYIRDVFALKVTQQPIGNPAFVTQNPNEVSQFRMAKNIGGAFGFLAHNDLAGENFSKITIGKNIIAIQENGVITMYTVSKILRFRAETPNSTASNFVPVDNNLKDIGRVMTSTEVFYSIYAPDKLVLQTCIDGNGDKPGDESWGRLFIIADKYQKVGFTLPRRH